MSPHAEGPTITSHPTRASVPIGTITRGTTNPNRLRRVDRWLAGPCASALRTASDPLVVDLGYGASPVTTRELLDRLTAVRPDIDVVGVEIDPARVADAQPYSTDRLSFVLGGFELPLARRRPVLVRAMNVLRQYDEAEVTGAWQRLCSRLAPGGLLVEGTCDELGRLATWVTLDVTGPRSLTLAAHLDTLDRPSTLAERLPKALIHRNIPGEPAHALLRSLDRAWDVAAGHAPFGARQRWLEAVSVLRADGTPVLHGPRRWRLGEFTVPWSVVAPAGGNDALADWRP